MMPIRANPDRPYAPDDWGAAVVDGALQLPPNVAQLLARHGIRAAEYIESTVEDLSTLFTHGLKATPEQLKVARQKLEAILRAHGIERETAPRFTVPAFGAMPPPNARHPIGWAVPADDGERDASETPQL